MREIRFRARDALALFSAYFFFVRVIVLCVCVLSLRSTFLCANKLTRTLRKKKYHGMGKTGTEKPLKAPKKKQKELDEDDLAALARKKEEQAKLNALKKQVAGGAKLGKGLSKSK